MKPNQLVFVARQLGENVMDMKAFRLHTEEAVLSF